MRIFLSLVIILLGANLAIELMNSEMLYLMEKRKERIEQAWEM